MKILLVSENKDLRELLSFHLSSHFSVQVKECASFTGAVAEMEAEGLGLVISSFPGTNSFLLESLKAKRLPVIFLVEAGVKLEAIGKLRVLGVVDNSKAIEGVSALVQPMVDQGAGVLDDYCPIRTNLLIRTTPLKGDVYIRLSKDKYVKLFRSGDEFDQQDLQKYYETKHVEYMYLRRTELPEFIAKFSKELSQLLARSDMKQEEVMANAELSQEAIHELANRIGFTDEVQELAKQNVALTLKAIGANPKLSDIVNRLSGAGNYISQHSAMLAHVSCCLAKEMQWASDSTFSKLALASFLHDIAVTDPGLAQLNTLKELEERKTDFPENLVKGYHLHPAKAGDVVRNFKEIPADVDLIVQQHHERPNGSGFPRGLAHNYIAPLACLFIMAHDLTQEILKLREKFVLADFVKERKPFFNQGNFKKIMASLEKIKL